MIPEQGICIISDRHLDIKNAIANWPRRDDGKTRIFHRYCFRHVASNFNTHFQNSTLKSAALKAGYTSQVVKFDTIMESIKQVKIKAIRNKKKVTGKDGKEKNQDYLPYTYLMREPEDTWTQSHDGGRRFGVMTTNISEYFNGVLKGAWGSEYTLSTWDENKCKYEKHYLKPFNNEKLIFQVVTQLNTCSAGGGNHSYEVQLRKRTCSCGKWKNVGIPCSHAIRVCDHLHIDSTTYIHPCYGLNNALNTYEHAFVVPKS